ncbi:tRNA (N6-threonylcarbamoyladenosine(37)-N6)-methyltransferase TrmO [Rhizobiales bacterium]|uniref:tRNA (N6-threonylcarbamoyladenosine(37)-N6)-methyltransferase TrmO n=1 Tax=Hongsoonwoonella zoysiae TaxID=2821844 RepID=UPI0015601383|nr:tRNA (N6-threonylcarbamoyladenosine(37)-N6)-methyltransferase TrmO [Hongsoonwoonella zoysiae]NRG19976.1 tRNA (N6-threonylcarbamoyladenosine(37)-N6)-methyltransferase TrmO [Hongsoonwoonella zoysiae]
MSDTNTADEEGIRPGEIAMDLPEEFDAGVYFIGRIRTPWASRKECPHRGEIDGPVCTIEVDPRWQAALEGIEGRERLLVLYWMGLARRDIVLQRPRRKDRLAGAFALRSPVRPNPIAAAVVRLEAVEGRFLKVRGLDCVDGTALVDIKPEFSPAERKCDEAEGP